MSGQDFNLKKQIMKTIQLDKKEIYIPTSLSEISFADYELWQKNKVVDELSYISRIAAICKLDVEDLLDESVETFLELENSLDFILSPNVESSESIIIDNTVYCISSYKGFTVGEWFDLEDIDNKQKEAPLAHSLAIICRPLDENYNSDIVEERAKIFGEQSCDKILPLVKHLQTRKQNLENTFNSSIQLVEDAAQFLSTAKAFESHGDGIQRLPFFQRKRYFALMKQLEKQLAEC